MGPMRRFIFFLVFVAVLVLLGWLIFRPRTPSTGSNVPEPVVLNDYADRDSKVVFTLRGRVNGNDEHRSVRITVARGSRTVELIQGYEGTVIKSQSYNNNPNAYRTFIHAISRYGFDKNRRTTQTNDNGACPLGNIYLYELFDNNDPKLRLWDASCDGIGTSAATSSTINLLFQRQITDYNRFMSGVSL